jgi:hemoglobin-like flavoprotein
MTPEQIALVERTLAEIAPDLDRVVADFYRRLFDADPALRELFTQDPDAQRAKFAAELGEVLHGLREHESFAPRTALLGHEHEGYGVRPRDYQTAGRALLEALAAALGPHWTVAVAEAWTRAYELTTAAMLAGTSATPAASPGTRRAPLNRF